MFNKRFSGLLVFAFFNLLCLAVFYPTISRPFLSDDYDVVYRVGIQKQFLIPGFFRPVSDFTIYFCYLLGGIKATVYNVFNLLVHAASSFVLYRFCLFSGLFPERKKQFIAWSAGLLFLVYPFHAESVLWMVGRASSISNFFGFLALLFAFSDMRPVFRYAVVSLCYFIGLASYETIFPLPLILLILLYQPQRSLLSYLPLNVWLGATLVIHLFVRNWGADSLTGQYGQKVFSPGIVTYGLNFLKVAGRLLLPPSGDSRMLAILFAALVILLGSVSIYLLRRAKEARLVFLKLLLALVIACIIPSMFGISTHTSEGDRLLYFASFFFVLWLVFLLSLLPVSLAYLSTGSLAVYFLVFLVISNRNWNEAGRMVNQVLSNVNVQRKQYTSFGLVNLPEEHNGAFVFRVGFPQALLIHQIDTTGISVLRKMTSEEAAALSSIEPQQKQGVVLIAPNTLINPKKTATIVHPVFFDTTSSDISRLQQVFYWNKKMFKPIY